MTRHTPVIGVLGAGAMGAGIAQIAASRGHTVVLGDARSEACDAARQRIIKALARDVEKQRLQQNEADRALERLLLQHIDSPRAYDAFAACDVVVEAIVEQLEAKRAAFRQLEAAVSADAILASNTSSLSIAAIGAACERPERALGVHFFNPATVMPLVEVVPGVRTDAAVVATARGLVDGWGKTSVLALDTPGFIVNRVARPYYSEALRMLDEGIAGVADIDWAMTALGGFRMGPFELMDFIGHDVNYVVTESVWTALYYEPRFKPSLTQKRLLEAGLLGKKSGRGFYDYRPGAERPAAREDPTLGRALLDRIVAMLVNEAIDAVYHRIASIADLEIAMTRGMNYPKGLLAWGDEIGLEKVLARIDSLYDEYHEDRYRASALLRRMVRDGKRFFND